jgi:hypothetical protein
MAAIEDEPKGSGTPGARPAGFRVNKTVLIADLQA